MQALSVFFIIGKDVFRPKQKGLSQWFSNCGPLTLKGGESSSLFRWFTIAKIKDYFWNFLFSFWGCGGWDILQMPKDILEKVFRILKFPSNQRAKSLSKIYQRCRLKSSIWGHGPEMTPWRRAWCGFKSRLKSCFWCHKINSTANPPVCQNCIHLMTK